MFSCERCCIFWRGVLLKEAGDNNKAVAVNTDISEEVVATQFWHRVGVDLVRANCRAFHRRLVSRGGDVVDAVGPLGGGGGLQVVEGL